jgi:hypothetical protein
VQGAAQGRSLYPKPAELKRDLRPMTSESGHPHREPVAGLGGDFAACQIALLLLRTKLKVKVSP